MFLSLVPQTLSRPTLPPLSRTCLRMNPDRGRMLMSNSAELVGPSQPFRAVSYPWRLYCGTGALDHLPAEVARHGARHAFIICGRTVAHRTNLLARIRDRLGGVYGGVFDR